MSLYISQPSQDPGGVPARDYSIDAGKNRQDYQTDED